MFVSLFLRLPPLATILAVRGVTNRLPDLEEADDADDEEEEEAEADEQEEDEAYFAFSTGASRGRGYTGAAQAALRMRGRAMSIDHHAHVPWGGVHKKHIVV